MEPCSITIDPTGNYSKDGASMLDIRGCLNYAEPIIDWIYNAIWSAMPLYLSVNEWYPFGVYEMEGGEMVDGTFKYPEDPDLHPLFKCIRGDEHVYIYAHAIIAISKPDGTYFVTRVD